MSGNFNFYVVRCNTARRAFVPASVYNPVIVPSSSAGSTPLTPERMTEEEKNGPPLSHDADVALLVHVTNKAKRGLSQQEDVREIITSRRR